MATALPFVAAGFSAHLCVDIKSKDDALQYAMSTRPGQVYPQKIDIKTLFLHSNDIVMAMPFYHYIQVFGQEFETYQINPFLSSYYLVSDIKKGLASYCGVHPSCQTLIYQGQQLYDHLSLAQQGVKPGSTMLMVKTGYTATEPVQTSYIDDDDLDQLYNYNFTNMIDNSLQFERAGYPYTRPCGWHRVALKVLGRYSDNVWLGAADIRTWSSSGEWAVSYHGTAAENIRPIASGGYDTGKCTRQIFGPGIYSTPSLVVAESYAKPFVFNGVKYKMLLQNRVNLNSSNIVSKESTSAEADYFVTPNDKDIRPYGVCLKQV